MPWKRVTVRRIHRWGKKSTHAATGRRKGVGYLRENGGEERREEEAVIAGAPAGAAAIATALRQERRRLLGRDFAGRRTDGGRRRVRSDGFFTRAVGYSLLVILSPRSLPVSLWTQGPCNFLRVSLCT